MTTSIRAFQIAAVLAGLGALAAQAHAGADNELSIGSYSRALRSSSANALTEDSLGGGTLAYARRLAFAPLPRLALWASGTFAWGGADGQMFQTLSTELDTVAFTAGARARYAVHPRLAAHARLELGTLRAGLELRDPMGRTASDARWGAAGTAALGVELFPIAHPSVSLGIQLELGYAATSGIALTPSANRADDGTLRLPVERASLGELDLGGPFFGASVIGLF
ncbi:MAG: hypothetical protein ACTHU0_15205 [Kofleriaceae bacterium]